MIADKLRKPQCRLQKCVAENRKWEETVALKLIGISEAECDLDLFQGW